MKKFFLLLTVFCLSYLTYAEHFVMMNVKNQQDLELMFQRKDLNIHYYNDNFILASAEKLADDMILLDNESFTTSDVYYIVYCKAASQDNYLESQSKNMETLYRNDNLLIVKPLNGNFRPAKNDGVVAVSDKTAKLTVQHRDFPVVTEENPEIRAMMNLVNKDSIQATVQHMQDYESRVFNSTQAYATVEWLVGKFEALGLEVETQDFTAPYYGESAPNVIAIQRGTVYPDEYVVCGSHYDSYSFYGLCPGADDNATGTASVLETARILTQHQFERSIVYCTFGCEEMGLYGSDAYATRCSQQGMNIIGYFNNDMNGYLYGDEIHIDCIYPNSVAPIGDYYMNIGSVYFPEMQIRHESFMSGDSDHTSFNQNGYMGIYPFEDFEHYSPYIHTPDDIIGTSVNSWEMSQRYCQMNMGCVTEIATPVGSTPVSCNAPLNFIQEIPVGDGDVPIYLSWSEPESGSTGLLLGYNLYKDFVLLNESLIPADETFYIDEDNNLHDTVMYYLIAVYDDGCEASTDTIEAYAEWWSIDENHVNNIAISPNPAQNTVTITADVADKEVEMLIVNVVGQAVKRFKFENTITLDVSDLSSGIYFVKAMTNNMMSKKLIIKK